LFLGDGETSIREYLAREGLAVTVEPAAWPAAAPAATGKLWLRAVGFCGVDESVEPAELAALVER
jgi:hypothetical protein